MQAISGNAREIVQGTVAEAIWTECCAVLNELNLAFNDVEIDCYKVAGYYKVCNAVLEDNDVDLATKLLEALSQAIGYAVDKAILYGRNTSATQKMPLGIMSRLAQTSEPSNYLKNCLVTNGLISAWLIAIIVESNFNESTIVPTCFLLSS